MARKINATRREFLKTATAASAALAIPYVITSKALGDDTTPPASDRITLAGIGLGNQGIGDNRHLRGLPGVQYIAVCDVRKGIRDRALNEVNNHNKNKDCVEYIDYRELLAREDLDAVHIATPDHWHAVMVIDACRAGKDVYCQKPETLTLREGPLMVQAARRYGRVVSGGSQRVLDDYRKLVNPIWSGERGQVKSINVAVGPLPQICNLPAEDVPEDINWDLWLGPAPWAPYNKHRCNGSYGTSGNTWRSYSDYSGGGMTDWGAHHFGGALFAVNVRELQPNEAIYHNDGGKEWVELVYPNGIIVTHNKPGVGNLHVESDTSVSVEALPVPAYKGTQKGIYGDFIECVKTREKPFRDIDLAVNTMVAIHLATLAYRVGRSLKWDSVKQEFPGDAEANRLMDRARREPWQL